MYASSNCGSQIPRLSSISGIILVEKSYFSLSLSQFYGAPAGNLRGETELEPHCAAVRMLFYKMRNRKKEKKKHRNENGGEMLGKTKNVVRVRLLFLHVQFKGRVHLKM